MPPLLHIALVFVGGGLGSGLRYAVNLALVARFGPHYPWGTFTVNVIGSAVMGIFAAWILARWTPEAGGTELRLFLMTGMLGGFTTFSAFSLDAWILWERGAQGAALAYVAASVVVSFAALAAGLLATRALLSA
ncbi:fluoride efflux transporter CrcB [Prosthecodimorpha staleyi]|uniref:Fluoride-specific ion channel FluC n=1 Tax=Prosthecodimorpha staleyi TaxID=2840188 RepID=A0A947G9L1_9HYPH|nr:fluoride efflux transporter CrcB [Prosthecodimorpha staleyi]MBT9288078.1 fluoride efflux transporter CrcB [Prosthecodimorpha staleyi]